MNELVILGAKWCRSCVSTKRMLKEFNDTHEPQIPFTYVDVEDRPEFVKAYNVQSVPVFIFRYPGGSDYFVHTGTATTDQILTKLAQ